MLTRVLGGLPIQEALDRYRHLQEFPEISFLCFRTLRHFYSLRDRLSSLLRMAPQELDREVWCLLLLGACQLQFGTRPAPICVSRTVDAARKVGKSSARSLVNAVLRQYDPDAIPQSYEAEWEAPEWLIHELEEAYPDHWHQILEVSLTRAPVALRVNLSRISLDDYRGQLNELEHGHTLDPSGRAVYLNDRIPMRQVPGYHDGLVSIQDGASQQAVPLLDIQSSQRVLDACASPGQKSRQILEQHPDVELTSIDVVPRNEQWWDSEMARLGLQASLDEADATTLDWWDGNPFDRVLVDVPCSGTGTMRRHPDLKVTLRPADVESAAELQLQLLQNLWETVADGGLLLYSTCSILPAENDAVVHAFRAVQENAEVQPLPLEYGLQTEHGHQLLPIEDGGDGFYFSLIRKVAEST